uniref:Uncharacterized protein n=1 Tax=Arundo donax TaxID=35708 RepID=A0A0A9EF87_ARUDO
MCGGRGDNPLRRRAVRVASGVQAAATAVSRKGN